MSLAPQRCPRCWATRVQRPLQAGRTGSFDLHACETCGGVWLGVEASRRILGDVEPAPSGQPPALFCPCCNGAATPLTVPPGVVVDRCDAHGVWFDARELDTICAAVARDKGVRVPARAAASVSGTQVAVLAAAAAGAATALAVADAPGSQQGPSPGALAGDALLTMPETVYFGAEAAAGAVSDVAGDVAEGAATVAEGAAEAGSSVLETLTDLLGALFD